jgi:hypothetical protein
MTYRLVQLAPGSYDVELDGMVVASLVQSPTSRRWTAELLDEREPHPAPFTAAEHRFDSFKGAQGWLGNPEVVHTPGGEFARGTILSGQS